MRKAGRDHINKRAERASNSAEFFKGREARQERFEAACDIAWEASQPNKAHVRRHHLERKKAGSFAMNVKGKEKMSKKTQAPKGFGKEHEWQELG